MSTAESALHRGNRLQRTKGRLARLGIALGAMSTLFAGTVPPAYASPTPTSISPSESLLTPSAKSDSGLTAEITTDNAGVVGPGQDLSVTITVSNSADSTVPAGIIDLWLDPVPMPSRGSLIDWLNSADPVTGSIPLGTANLSLPEKGASTVVHMTAPAASLPFVSRPESAVFGIGATVTAEHLHTTARGSVVWSATESGPRSNIAVVMPIVSPPTADGLLSAAELATYTAPNGVLTRDLDGLVGHSAVTVGIDPMIIASIRALGNAAPPSAVDWLARLATLTNETFSLGYGDADLTGQLQAGVSAPLAPTSLHYALDPKNFSPTPTLIGEPATPSPPAIAGGATSSPAPSAGPSLPSLEELIGWDFILEGIAWPGDKSVRTADLTPLAAAGFSTVIVSGDNTNAAELDTTPNAAIPAHGNLVVASDKLLSDSLREAISAPSDVAWSAAMAKLNAQLQLISAEGGDPRNLLIGLDRSWPSSGTQLKRTLDALYASPWAYPSTLAMMRSTAATSGVALIDTPEPETRTNAIRTLLSDETALGAFSSVLDDPQTLTGRTRAQLLTLLAVSWQSPKTEWSAAVAASHKSTITTLHSIRILPTENVNLVSAQGSIPFTVSNELSDEPATVVLTAATSNSRLEIDDSTTKRIPQDSRATILVPVKAKVGNGQVMLSLHLYSPTGIPIGEPTSVTVDVHADWENLGALILGILLVLFFGFGIVRNILRRRKGRRQEDADTATPAETVAAADGQGVPAGAESAQSDPPMPETTWTTETETETTLTPETISDSDPTPATSPHPHDTTEDPHG